jgi:ferritin
VVVRGGPGLRRKRLAHESLPGGGDKRDRFGEENPHRVPKGDRLLVRRALHLHLLQRSRGELDRRIQGERRELLPLRFVDSLRLPLRELAQTAHELLRIAPEREAKTALHGKYSTHVPRFAGALNEQIAHEFAASQQYVAIAVWYDAETLRELAAHFYRQALEERNHAMMIVQYLLDAGERVAIPAVAQPQNDFADPVAPVRLALEQERTVTEQISRLAALAREEQNLVGEEFLNWFLKEQREEVASMSSLLAVVERAGDNMLLGEEYLARHQIGDAGVDPTAPAAAGGAL